MGKGSSAPEYSSATVNTGLFGSSTTNGSGSTWNPTDFQKNAVKLAEDNSLNYLSEYLNPNYDSEAFHQSDSYYTNKLNNQLQDNYLNGALSSGLLKGSTASDIMRGFANDLANTEYERQQDYKNQQLQNYQAAMLPYSTIYDMATGQTQLSNNLANNISNYNLQAYNAEQQANNKMSGIGSLLGGVGSVAGSILGSTVAPGIGTAIGGAIGGSLGNSTGSSLSNAISSATTPSNYSDIMKMTTVR